MPSGWFGLVQFYFGERKGRGKNRKILTHVYAPLRIATFGIRMAEESRNRAGQAFLFFKACLTAPTGTAVSVAAYAVKSNPALYRNLQIICV